MLKVFSIGFMVVGINEVVMFSAIAFISHLLTKEGFGDFQSFVASMRFFGAVLTFGLAGFITKYIPVQWSRIRNKEWSEIRKLYQKTIYPIGAIALILFSIIMTTLILIFEKENINHPFLMMSFVALLETAFTIGFSYLRSNSKYISAISLYTVKSVTFLVLLFVINFFFMSLYTAIICYIAAYVIAIVYFFVLKFCFGTSEFKKKSEQSLEPVNWKTFIFPYSLLSIASHTFSALAIIVFELFCVTSEHQVGDFCALMGLFGLSLIVVYPLKVFSVNELSKIINEPKKINSTMLSLLGFGLIVTIVLFVIFYMISPWIIYFMSPLYHDLIGYYRLMLTLLIVIGIANPFSSYVKVADNSNVAIVTIILSTIIFMFCIGGYLSFKFGLDGMVVTLFSSYFLYMTLNIVSFWVLHLKPYRAENK